MSSNDNAENKVIPLSHYVQYQNFITTDSDSNLKKRLMEDQIVFLAEDVGAELLDFLDSEGFDVDNDAMRFDLTYAMEAVKAALYRQRGIYHPLQEIIDQAKS